MMRTRRAGRLAAIAAIVALIASGVTLLFLAQGKRAEVTAHFDTVVGLYPGSDVRVLGVAVGEVTAVAPRGSYVEVEMALDPDVDIPADASAMVVTPSLVSDRYIQLAPVYVAGPLLTDGALIPSERTAVPLEVDEVFASVDRFATALGPDGANAEGALSELLSSGAANLEGTGAKFNEAIRELSKAAVTMGDSGEDFFATIDHLDVFTEMLATSDSQLRRFDEQLGDITEFFAEERDDLGAALAELAQALSVVEGFVADHRDLVASNVDKLDSTARLLAEQKDSLAEALERAPHALEGLLRTYDSATGTIRVRANLNEFSFGDPNAPRVPLPRGEGGN